MLMPEKYIEIMKAYSDCNPYHDGDRDLHFKGEEMDASEALDALSFAVPYGYNRFQTNKLRYALTTKWRSLLREGYIRIIPAREYSVCIYIRAVGREIEDFSDSLKPALKNADTKFDEYMIKEIDGKQYVRVWWD